jgi:hypothetical protein
VSSSTPATGQHIAGDRETIALDMPAPVDALVAGKGGDPAAGIHDVQLPAGVAAIGGDQRRDDVARGASFTQQLQTVDAVIGIDERLSRNTANPGGDIGHAPADREKLRRDRNTELAGGVVAGDDRPGHLGSFKSS